MTTDLVSEIIPSETEEWTNPYPKNHTRLYSMSRGYTMPDYADRPVPHWPFVRLTNTYELLLIHPELVPETEALPPPLVSSLN